MLTKGCFRGGLKRKKGEWGCGKIGCSPRLIGGTPNQAKKGGATFLASRGEGSNFLKLVKIIGEGER